MPLKKNSERLFQSLDLTTVSVVVHSFQEEDLIKDVNEEKEIISRITFNI